MHLSINERREEFNVLRNCNPTTIFLFFIASPAGLFPLREIWWILLQHS